MFTSCRLAAEKDIIIQASPAFDQIQISVLTEKFIRDFTEKFSCRQISYCGNNFFDDEEIEEVFTGILVESKKKMCSGINDVFHPGEISSGFFIDKNFNFE